MGADKLCGILIVTGYHNIIDAEDKISDNSIQPGFLRNPGCYTLAAKCIL